MPRWNGLTVAFAIVVVLAGGWATAVWMLGRSMEKAWLGVAAEDRVLFEFLANGGVVLIPATPAVAAVIAARQGWAVLAWILGGLAVVIVVLVAIWAVANWNT
ncbi:hypothetical protein [Actinoplanes sp. NPDC026623]|uniref:hypothetical protein n=1 Tax=Actinoplanes sp. NPDC026623 TaxID=3155610 RepID=UPI0033FEF0C4